MKINEGKRWSGADWASEQKDIMIVGCGGIGSWLALSLSRIGHSLILVDGDIVDETNVGGGQLYRTKDVGKKKVVAVTEICREFGCLNEITPVAEMYDREMGATGITITGLDNMAARKQIFEDWIMDMLGFPDSKCLLIDGRLLIENAELFCIEGDNEASIKEYKENWLFNDSEVPDMDCTLKQSTFAAMGIASLITATLCNWLTNRKLECEFREVPFHQRMYYPALDYRKSGEIVVMDSKLTII